MFACKRCRAVGTGPSGSTTCLVPIALTSLILLAFINHFRCRARLEPTRPGSIVTVDRGIEDLDLPTMYGLADRPDQGQLGIG